MQAIPGFVLLEETNGVQLLLPAGDINAVYETLDKLNKKTGGTTIERGVENTVHLVKDDFEEVCNKLHEAR